MLWFNYIFNVENINYGGQSMKKQLINIGACVAISASVIFAGNYATYAEENDSTVWTESNEENAPESTPEFNPDNESIPDNSSLPDSVPTSTIPASSSPSTPVLNDNLVEEGGHVNVEGLPAKLSEDGQGVTYSYIVAFQRMHSSDHGQTVSDLRMCLPNLPYTDIKFTLVGTRDANSNPVPVNVPMVGVDVDDVDVVNNPDVYAYNLPTAEEVQNGKTAYYVTKNMEDESYDKVKFYNVYSNVNLSQAIKVEVTLPLEDAKNIKYLPIDARMVWKASQEGGIVGYESGAQHLEEYANHNLFDGNNGNVEYGGFGDPASIDDSYVSNGHLIKSVAKSSTYITPNNGDWTTIPNDTNIDENTFFAYAKIFTLRANSAVTYYISEKEDMADQDVSHLQLGSVVVDYVIAGEGTSIKATYIDTNLRPLYNADDALAAYNTAENANEAPQSITYDGKEYTLVGTSATSAPATGVLAEGVSHVVYEYALAATPTPVPTPSTPAASTPKTADTTNLAGYVAALLAAFVAFSVTAVNRYKSNQIF